MTFTAIAAMDEDRAIGLAGQLPWHLPEDTKWFREQTMGHPVVMGRKTYESIGGPLPGRFSFVMAHRLPVPAGPYLICRSREDLMDKWEWPELQDYIKSTGIDTSKVFIIGGEQIYREFLPHCSEILLTALPGTYGADAFFPEFEDQFGEPEVIRRIDGVAEWRRYLRKEVAP